jgi:putative modified peptide
MATKKATTPGLDPKVADKLLDKLGTDNDFRRLFKKDPAAALVKVGHPKDAAAFAGRCSQVQSIAPKAEIQATRELIKAHLTSMAAQTIIFCFESGKVAQSLRRK